MGAAYALLRQVIVGLDQFEAGGLGSVADERPGQTEESDLHETDIFGWPIIVIVLAIHIVYRRGCKLILVDIIK